MNLSEALDITPKADYIPKEFSEKYYKNLNARLKTDEDFSGLYYRVLKEYKLYKENKLTKKLRASFYRDLLLFHEYVTGEEHPLSSNVEEAIKNGNF